MNINIKDLSPEQLDDLRRQLQIHDTPKEWTPFGLYLWSNNIDHYFLGLRHEIEYIDEWSTEGMCFNTHINAERWANKLSAIKEIWKWKMSNDPVETVWDWKTDHCCMAIRHDTNGYSELTYTNHSVCQEVPTIFPYFSSDAIARKAIQEIWDYYKVLFDV